MDIEEFIKKFKNGKTGKVAQDIEIIYERLKSGEIQENIAKEYNISTSEVNKVLMKYCLYFNKSKIIKRPAISKLKEKDIQEIIKEYDNEHTKIEDLAEKYNVSKSTIRWHVRNVINKEPVLETTYTTEKEHIDITINDLQIEKEKNADLKQEIVSKVIQMYESKKSIKDIELALNIENKDVRFILMNYMDVKDKKMSKRSIEILQKLGYDIELIQKVAKERSIEIEKQGLKPSQEDEIQL